MTPRHSSTIDNPPRSVLLVPNTQRSTNMDACITAATQLRDAGLDVAMTVSPGSPEAAVDACPQLRDIPRRSDPATAADGADIILVLGGDGTFLRAADIAHRHDIPVLGVNLGHVGFLAEWEHDALDVAVDKLIHGDFTVTDRMSLDITVTHPDGTRHHGWALNEVSVENNNRRGVLDATLAIDSHPVSTFGCDGVLISSPTGSTAYAFSAGGPVLWPELDAILVVPNNAHALFTKPLVVSPTSTVTVESHTGTSAATAVMDGFRVINFPPGSRIDVVRGARPVRWVKLDDATFTDRLVTKLRLPVDGWRGTVAAPVTINPR